MQVQEGQDKLQALQRIKQQETVKEKKRKRRKRKREMKMSSGQEYSLRKRLPTNVG